MSRPEDVRAGDLPGILALNNANAAELSWLEPDRLVALVVSAWRARRVGHVDAFMIVFDEHAAYDSANFLWFRERSKGFAYVDRVAVSPHMRGRGIARLLYADLAAAAQAKSIDQIVCEVNLRPRNDASLAFHAALGFEAVGEAEAADGRIVRYLSRPARISDAASAR